MKPVIGIEFFGRLERFMLAADASIWSDYNSKALLSLPAVWSAWGNLQQLGHARAGSSSTGAQPDASLLNGELTNFGAVFPGRIPIWGYNMADFADSGHVLPALPDGTADGVTSGRIDFVPSRSIALEAGLSSYLGEKVSVRIPSLEVTTIPAQWTEKQGCH